MLKLEIKKREGTAAKSRSTGMIPGVFYGPKAPSTSIEVNGSEFKKAFRKAGESTIVTLTGVDEEHDALIHDVTRDPISGDVTHVDFYVIEKGKKVQVHTQLEFVGEAPAVKTLGGILTKVMHEVEIEALPKDLPHSIEVDISSLVDFDSQIKVSDIKLPAGVSILSDADEVVALASKPKEETDEVAAPIDIANIELSVEKGKKEEEEIPAA